MLCSGTRGVGLSWTGLVPFAIMGNLTLSLSLSLSLARLSFLSQLPLSSFTSGCKLQRQWPHRGGVKRNRLPGSFHAAPSKNSRSRTFTRPSAVSASSSGSSHLDFCCPETQEPQGGQRPFSLAHFTSIICIVLTDG